MPFVIRFTDPDGKISYWPKGFGFDSHEHATNVAEAERFHDRARATRSLNGYLHPPAFWNSERAHAANMREKFRGWNAKIVTVSEIGKQSRSRDHGRNVSSHL